MVVRQVRLVRLVVPVLLNSMANPMSPPSMRPNSRVGVSSMMVSVRVRPMGTSMVASMDIVKKRAMVFFIFFYSPVIYILMIS